MIKLEDIQKAKDNFPSFVKETPLEYSARLSEIYGANIYLKREDLQKIRSYKIRGSYNLISQLTDIEREAGVVCASAGNHAQGVALACYNLGIRRSIYMPLTTPTQKVYKTKQFGGEYVNVVLMGDTFDEALAGALEFQKSSGATFVHPFDDEKIIIGQATVALEILNQSPVKLDYIISPIGGGGLISGAISATQAISPKTMIIGVEPLGRASMGNSILSGENKTLDIVDTFVDGASVKRVGELNYNIVKNYNPEIFKCPEDRIATTIIDYLNEDGMVIEPAGALSTDVLKDPIMKSKIRGKNIALIISGGNFDFDRLPEIKERSLKYEGLKKYILVSFPQRPGALKEFLSYMGDQDDITRFEYLKKSKKEKAPALIGITSDRPENFTILFEKLKKANIYFEDITNNDFYFDLLI